MSRSARITCVGLPHRVTHRGNPGQLLFETIHDYKRYLGWLEEYANQHSIEIWAYCLLPAWVHYVCVPHSDRALARGFNILHIRFAQFRNRNRGDKGRLWKGRFLSCLMDSNSSYEEIRKIENYPVREGLVEKAEDYPWSSASSHVFGNYDPILSRNCPYLSREKCWRTYLNTCGDEYVLKRTRRSLMTGRPAGDLEFIRSLEKVFGRSLESRPRGRPRKNTNGSPANIR